MLNFDHANTGSFCAGHHPELPRVGNKKKFGFGELEEFGPADSACHKVNQKPARKLAVFVEVYRKIALERGDNPSPLLLVLLGLPEDHLELGPGAVLGEKHGIELLILRLAAAFIFAANAEDQHAVGGPDKRIGEWVATLGVTAHKGHNRNLCGLKRGLFRRLDLWLLGHGQI